MIPRALIVSCVAWAALCACAFADEDERFKLPHISVDGWAGVEVRPDLATLVLGAESEKPTAQEAASDIASAASSVIASLKQLGVDAKDIQTLALTIDPVMVEERDPKTNAIANRKLAGYRATTLFHVRVRDVDKAGQLAGRVVETGANAFRSLNFEVSDYTERLDQQRATAVAEAMRRAALYASGAKMKLGRLLEINPDPDNYGNAAALPTRKGPPPSVPVSIVIPVEPGMENISAHVTATWELVPD